MARFDLHRRGGRLLVDVQSDILPSLGTRLVVPLFEPATVPRPLRRLHPILAVEGRPYLLATHLMGAVPTAELGPPVGSLRAEYDTIVTAIDMVFLGF